jgi:exodeoxyribonuclease VII small subunit
MTKSPSPFPLQQKVQRLEEIEKYFQQADVDLDTALAMHEEAIGIAKEIQAYLQKAEQRLESIHIAELRREA